jgi:phospholipid-binding lipoprotein MlaA
LLATLLAFVAPPAGAQSLPPDLAGQIEAAAIEGRANEAKYGDRMDGRRTGVNRQLEVVVVEAIVVRPDLVGPIVAHAVTVAPESKDYLVPFVAEQFPSFSNTIRASAGGTAVVRSEAPQPVYAASTTAATAPIAGVPPPDQRPPDWPVLPREGGADGYDDPLEGMNRVFFYMNGALDFLFFDPLSRVYRFLMPDPAKPAISRAFTNLAEPVVFANHLLQFEFERAGTSLGRFLVNSTFGVAGLFDVATEFGFEADDADFGQTLHSYGVGDGFYLVLPFFGPSTVRDAVGFGVDSFLDPRGYVLDFIPRLGLALGEGVVRREEVIDPVDFLVEYAEDPYYAVRAWTYQQRMRELTGECTSPQYVVCPGGALGN